MTNGDQPPEHKKQKPKVKKADESLNDAYKFGIFALRALIAAATGKHFGDTSVDNALGDAIASIHAPQDVADLGLGYTIALGGAAGAWRAIVGDAKWE
jgi:hypothetical protein